jgi:uncharacterized membrane protein
MPDVLPTHWNANGKADGYANKTIALFMFPTIILILALVFYFIPKIGPTKTFIKDNRKYDIFSIITISFLSYFYILTILWYLKFEFNLNQMLSPAFMLIFITIGYLLPDLKKNYFIGIKTPWALADDKVWKKTHVLGSKLFIGSGIISGFGIFIPAIAIYLMVGPILLSAAYLYYYSFKEYKNLNNS